MYGTLISSVTVGAGGAANISFGSIPATYTDLVLVTSTRQDSFSNNQILIRFNNDSGANYSVRRLTGSGSAASSQSYSSQTSALIGYASPGPTETANTFGNALVYIPNYAGSTAKSISADAVEENNATAAYQGLNAALWSGTSAISSIIILPDGGNFAQYSTAYLYGLTKGSGGATVS